MDYIKWNDLIGDIIFGKEENQGKIVFLYVDKNLLVESFKEKFRSDTRNEDEIWRDFINAINNPSIKVDSYGHCFDCPFSADENSYLERMEKLIRWYGQNSRGHAKSKYPIFLAYLIIPIIAKTQFRSSGVKKALKDFFIETVRHTDSDLSNSNYLLKAVCFTKDRENGGLWKDLHNWSLKNGFGITYYDFNPDYDKTWKYVNMVMDQCLINANDKIKARALYDRVGLNVNSAYTFKDFKNHLLAYQNIFGQYFDTSAVKELKGKNSINLYKVLYNDFLSWDGSFDEGDKENLKRVQSHYIRICIDVDRTNKSFTIQYRLKVKIEEPIKICYQDNRETDFIFPDHGEWSTPLKNPFINIVEGTRHKSVFRFNESKVYLLTKQPDFDGCVFVSRDELLYEGNKVFFITKEELAPCQNLKRFDFTNSEGFILYSYVVNPTDTIVSDGGLLNRFMASDDDIQETEKIIVIGGLYVKQKGTGLKGYLSDFPPVLHDKQFLECLYIYESEDIKNRHQLISDNSDDTNDHKTWNLPADLSSGTYIVEGTAIRIPILGRTEIQPAVVNNHPYIKSDGTMCPDRPDDICMVDNDITCNFEGKYPRDYLCHSDNARLSPINDDFNFTFGDYLIDWLFFNGECSRDDFSNAFQLLQEKLESQRPELKKLSKYATPISALRWLEKGGYVDVYENKVIPCSPHIVILPVTSNICNKFRLIGCRGLSMVEKIREICRVQNNKFRFQVEQTNDNYLIERLTPTSIFIEAKGSYVNDYGFESIIRYICNPLSIKKPVFNYLYHLNQFALETTELNGDWLEFNESNPYRDFKCYLFNENTYEYDQSRYYVIKELFDTIDDYKLIKISLAAYHNVYVVLDGVNKNYIKINDEAHAKMFVLYKNNPNQWGGSANKCIKKVYNTETGYTDIYVAKRVDLPKALVRYLNVVSILPPSISIKKIPNSNLRYYVYPIHDDLYIKQIVAVLSEKTGSNLNPNTINL